MACFLDLPDELILRPLPSYRQKTLRTVHKLARDFTCGKLGPGEAQATHWPVFYYEAQGRSYDLEDTQRSAC